MNITIFGAGNMGRSLGMRFAAGGHAVTFVDQQLEKAEKMAAEVENGGNAKVTAAAVNDVELGDVVVLAVWYGANIELVKQLGSKLAGKVVIDIANPLNDSFDGLATVPGSSSAEEVAAAAPGVSVVKAFNTTFAGNLSDGQVAGQPLDVFIAGDDTAARHRVAQLVADGGMHPIDAGPLERARSLESMQLLHILLQSEMGTNFRSAFKIVH